VEHNDSLFYKKSCLQENSVNISVNQMWFKEQWLSHYMVLVVVFNYLPVVFTLLGMIFTL